MKKITRLNKEVKVETNGTHAGRWLASPRLYTIYLVSILTRHRIELYPVDITRTVRRRDTGNFGSNNECIRVSRSRSISGEVKLGEDGIVVIDEIMGANKGDVGIVEELIYQVPCVKAIVLLPSIVDFVLTFLEICCAVKASDVDQAGNGTSRTIQPTLIVARKTTAKLDSRIFP